MATTSPDNIRTPDPSDPYNLVPDLAQMAGDVQTALIQRANSYKGTSTQRTAFTATAADGVIWQDTNSPYRIWRKQGGSGGSWEPLVPFEDTGWITIPYNPGYVSGPNDASSRLEYRIRHGIVYVRGGAAKESGVGFPPDTGETVAALPVGARPSMTPQPAVAFTTSNRPCFAAFGSTVYLRNTLSVSVPWIACSFSFPLG